MSKVKSMFCNKCGAKIPDNSQFCGNCGQKFERKASVDEAVAPETEYNREIDQTSTSAEDAKISAVESSPTEQDFAKPTEPAPKRKKSFKLPIIIGSIAIVLIALAIALIGNFKSFFVKNFGSEEEYAQYVEEKAFTDYAEKISAVYGDFIERTFHTNGTEGEIEVSISEDAHAFIQEVSNVELNWLKSIGLNFEASKDGELAMLNGELKVCDEHVTDLTAIFDMIDGSGYLTLDGLTEKYLGFEFQENQESAFLYDPRFAELFPSEKAFNDLLNQYIAIVVEKLDDVSKTSETLSVGGIEQKVTKVTITVDYDCMVEIVTALLNEVKQNKDTKEYFFDFANYFNDNGYIDVDAQESYDEMLEEIDEYLADLNAKTNDRDDKLVITNYVDSDDEITGLEITFADEEICSIKTACKNKQFATVILCEGFKLEGSGEKLGDTRSGKFTLYKLTTPLFTIDVEDFDAESLLAGTPKGKVKMSPTNEFLDLIDVPSSTKSVISLLDLALNFDFNCSEDSSEIVTSVTSKDDALISVSVKTNPCSGDNVKIPDKKNVIDADDANKWLKTVDTKTLIENLEKAGLPKKLGTSLQTALKFLSV